MPRRGRGHSRASQSHRGQGRGRGRGRGGGGGYGSSSSYPGTPSRHPLHSHNYDELDAHPRNLTLREEARNTERHGHRTQWNPATGLRHQPIGFVFAGQLEPADLLKPVVADSSDDEDNDVTLEIEADLLSDSPNLEADQSLSDGINLDKLQLGATIEVEAEVERAEEMAIDEGPNFVVDIIGDPSLAPEADAPVIRQASPSPSQSSSASERIVFVPRKQRGSATSRSVSPQRSRSANRQSSPRPARALDKATELENVPVKTKITSTHTETTTVINGGGTKMSMQQETKVNVKKTEESFIPPESSWNGKRSTPGNKRRQKQKGRRRMGKDDDSAVEDYMENLAAQMRAEATEDGGESSNAMNNFNKRDLGGDEWVDESSTDEEDAASDDDAVERYKYELWEEDELEDFDAISTDNEGMKGVVETVLGRRKRPSGLQYLIKWAGLETDYATWVLAEVLDSSADDRVKLYEEKASRREAEMLQSSDDTSDELEGDDEEDTSEADEEADENEDFKLAQLLQKQEGFGFADLDMDVDLEEMDAEIMGLSDDFFPMGKSKRKKRRPPVPDIQPDYFTGQYPSASRMAAQYDEFDVMDWDRPSIAMPKRKGKGKGKHVQLYLSDSELEAQIQSAWSKDRERKKVKKQEREALRAEGLLGQKARKTGKKDLSAKYSEGMKLDEVLEEIKEFMMQGHTSLPLTPMDKRDRKIVHEIASKLHLKSKSVGAGKKRFPTLYKTSRTTLYEFDEEGIDAVLRSQTKRFLRRMDVGGGKTIRKAAGARGGGGPMGHREGDIVGASAPELAADNLGRKMLEKMGYKSGMALGAENNKGIVNPLFAVVKVSKAGLG